MPSISAFPFEMDTDDSIGAVPWSYAYKAEQPDNSYAECELTGEIRDASIRLEVVGNLLAERASGIVLPTSAGVQVYGSPSDLWGGISEGDLTTLRALIAVQDASDVSHFLRLAFGPNLAPQFPQGETPLGVELKITWKQTTSGLRIAKIDTAEIVLAY